MSRNLTVAVLLATVLASCDRTADTHNCDDFEYQQDAQVFYDREKTAAIEDPHHLDDNGDGYACERLPERPRGAR